MSAIKEEPPMDVDDDQEENEPPSFAAALGLQRVGSAAPAKQQAPQHPVQVLNARGMPARIRKKNKLFFDDNIVNDKPQRTSPLKKPLKPMSPIKSPINKQLKRGGAPIKSPMSGKLLRHSNRYDKESPVNISHSRERKEAKPQSVREPMEREIYQRIGLRLRNLLKLPKAHKFVSYEWFYSSIDKALFDGENDFQTCLKESFPLLKTRMLTRVEWSTIRRLMGKPRRCSAAFFLEERSELERRRQKIRVLQSRKSADEAYIKDLPSEIPLALPVGTKVTARLRQPQDGIFMGSIDAVDTLSSIYRITFDRPGLGTQSIPDYEVLANDFHETLAVSSLIRDLRPKLMNGSMLAAAAAASANNRSTKTIGMFSSTNKNDPLLGSEIYNNSKLKNCTLPKETIGGFPLKLLELMRRTRKTLIAKQMKLLRLKNMNAEAEMYKSFGEPFPDDYQRRYASIVIGMETLNTDMRKYLSEIQQFNNELVKEPSGAAMLAPSYLREKCRELAVETVAKNKNAVKNETMLRLITDLATIMWVASNMTNDEQSGYVLKTLNVCLEEGKSNLVDLENVEVFQKNVHVHMRHIENDMLNDDN